MSQVPLPALGIFNIRNAFNVQDIGDPLVHLVPCQDCGLLTALMYRKPRVPCPAKRHKRKEGDRQLSGTAKCYFPEYWPKHKSLLEHKRAKQPLPGLLQLPRLVLYVFCIGVLA